LNSEIRNGARSILHAWGRIPPSAWVGISVLLFWIGIALFGPWFTPHGEAELLTNDSFAPPGVAGLLGGDYLGRDILSRLFFGARRTLGLAALITILAFAVGVLLGFLSAVAGRWIEGTFSRVNDVLLAFPSLILALIVIAALGTSLSVLVLTVALIEATRVFRVARALGMDIVAMDYIEAARARGEGSWWIMWREILPNAMAPLAAEFGVRFTYSILFVSALSFLGLGVQPPNADWGVMVKENLQGLLFGSMAPLIPAAAIASVTIAINLLVDWQQQQSSRDVSYEPML
jgi:peptide/nickel transport system permease protein